MWFRIAEAEFYRGEWPSDLLSFRLRQSISGLARRQRSRAAGSRACRGAPRTHCSLPLFVEQPSRYKLQDDSYGYGISFNPNCPIVGQRPIPNAVRYSVWLHLVSATDKRVCVNLISIFLDLRLCKRLKVIWYYWFWIKVNSRSMAGFSNVFNQLLLGTSYSQRNINKISFPRRKVLPGLIYILK